jgi:hypothetical protein
MRLIFITKDKGSIFQVFHSFLNVIWDLVSLHCPTSLFEFLSLNFFCINPSANGLEEKFGVTMDLPLKLSTI